MSLYPSIAPSFGPWEQAPYWHNIINGPNPAQGLAVAFAGVRAHMNQEAATQVSQLVQVSQQSQANHNNALAWQAEAGRLQQQHVDVLLAKDAEISAGRDREALLKVQLAGVRADLEMATTILKTRAAEMRKGKLVQATLRDSSHTLSAELERIKAERDVAVQAKDVAVAARARAMAAKERAEDAKEMMITWLASDVNARKDEMDKLEASNRKKDATIDSIKAQITRYRDEMLAARVAVRAGLQISGEIVWRREEIRKAGLEMARMRAAMAENWLRPWEDALNTSTALAGTTDSTATSSSAVDDTADDMLPPLYLPPSPPSSSPETSQKTMKNRMDAARAKAKEKREEKARKLAERKRKMKEKSEARSSVGR